MSLWMLLQRRMDQSSVPVAPACPPAQSSAPGTRHDSTPRRSATPARTPERRPRTPERFLRTPQRSTRTPDGRVRTPVRRARSCSESRDSRSSSPVSRSSSVESSTRDGSPVNFTAAMDPDDEEVEKTTFSETLNTASSTFKFLTVKQIFPREPYRLKIHRDALYVPKPPGDHGFSDNKAPSSYQVSHRMCLDTEELARRSAIYASLADSMVASVIEELSPKDERSKLLREKLAIIQEAQVSVVSAGFAAASNLQLLRPDALLKNFKFQPQVISSVRTALFEGNHVVGPEPKVLQNRVCAIRQADRMAGSSVTFDQKNREPASTKVTSSKKTAPRPSVFDRLGSPTSTPQRTVTQESPFRAGSGRARPWPFQGSKKSGKASSSTSTRQRWRVPGGGSPGRLCPALAESAGQLPGHRHRRGRGGHCFPATASAHPSKHQFPDQEQPSGPSASSRWLADEGGHRAGLQLEETFVMPTFMLRCIRLSASICVSWSTRRCTSSLVFRLDWRPIHESSPSCCEPPSRCLGSKVWSYTSI